MRRTNAPRRARLVVLGLPYFGRRLVGNLSARGWEALFIPHPGRSAPAWASVARQVGRADLLYLISARAETNAPLDWLLRAFRRSVVVHWVGTDVLIAAEVHARGRLSTRVVHRAIHWCDAPWLVDELAAIGIDAAYVPLPVADLLRETPPPLPERFRALLYLPVDPFDREVFDVETILRLPTAFPDIEFILIPSPPETLPGPLPPNLVARSWVEDMDALYASVTCYLRLTHHDGTPFTVLEALSRGRHVIFTHPMPAVRLARGFEAVAAELRQLVDAHAAGTLALNMEGVVAVTGEYAGDYLANELSRRLWRTLRPRQRGRFGRSPAENV